MAWPLIALAAASAAANAYSKASDKSGTSTKLKRINVQTPEQQELMKQMGTWLTGNMGKPAPQGPDMFLPRTGEEDKYFNWAGSQTATPDLPDTFAGKTDEEQATFDWTRGLAQNVSLNRMRSGQPQYDLGPEAASEFFRTSIQNPAMEQFEQEIMPIISEKYGNRFGGSGMQLAAGKATRGMARDLASQRGELMYAEKLAERQAIDQAMTRALEAETFFGGATGKAGDLSRLIAEARVKGGMDKYALETEASNRYGKISSDAGTLSREIGQEEVMSNLGKFLSGQEVDGQYNEAYSPNIALAYQLLGIQPYAVGGEMKTQGPGTASAVAGGISEFANFLGMFTKGGG